MTGQGPGPLPRIDLDPEVEITPQALFRDLEEGRAPLLVDVRPHGGKPSLEGALTWPGEGWEPPADRDTVLFDHDGTSARDLARRLRARGFRRVRSLFGGVRLYDFALDPEVVGAERFLV